MERDLTYNAPKIKFTDTEGQEEHFISIGVTIQPMI